MVRWLAWFESVVCQRHYRHSHNLSVRDLPWSEHNVSDCPTQGPGPTNKCAKLANWLSVTAITTIDCQLCFELNQLLLEGARLPQSESTQGQGLLLQVEGCNELFCSGMDADRQKHTSGDNLAHIANGQCRGSGSGQSGPLWKTV